MEKEIKVSILCTVYNHGKYIRQTLQSFIDQKTNFKFEVLVHDDASTDDSQLIIKDFEEKYPEIIKPIYQTENQHSKGVKISFTYQYPRIKGKYFAFCEGDDYWTDSNKLQKQFDAMESHPEVDICAHAAKMISEKENGLLRLVAPKNEDTVIPVEDVIAGGGGFVATSSLFCRSEISKYMPEFRNFFNIDYTLQIQGSLRGGMLYIADCMSVYRYLVPASWTSRQRKSLEKRIETSEKIIQMLKMLDSETSGKYSKVIDEIIKTNEYDILSATDKNKEILKPEYKEIFREKSASERFKIRLKAYFPWLIKIKRRKNVRK